MRKLLILLLLIYTCHSYAAWHVFSVNGDVKRHTTQGWKSLIKGDELFPTDRIRMEQYASLSIIDNQSKKIYSVQSSKEAKLGDLIQQAKSASPSNIARYWKIVQNIMHNQNTEEFNGSAGVNYRDANADKTIASLLRRQLIGTSWSAIPSLHTDYALELHVISTEDGELSETVREGERVRLLVSNHSDMALFVAIMDVDAGGIPQVILPHDMPDMISHTLIPAYSTVMLPELVSFAPAGIDHLYLIAYDEPFDMQQVLTLIQTPETGSQAPSSVKLGSARLSLSIKH